jgi:hypothetical protein
MLDEIIERKSSQNQLNLIIENLQESIIVFNKKMLINVNKMFTEQFGVIIN